MTLPTVLLLTFVVLAAMTWLLLATFLWLGCRWAKIEQRGPIRVLGTSLAVIVLAVACFAILVMTLAAGSFESDTSAVLSMLLLLAVSTLLLMAAGGGTWWFVKRFLATTPRQAAQATMAMLVPTLMLLSVPLLLLPFGVRAAVGEAFVVPTGAMATAIQGQHVNVQCPDCGWTDAVGMLPQSSRLRRFEVSETRTCPMCGLETEVSIQGRPRSGDRIISDKLAVPRRFDIVVFRPPNDPDTMYVHRLVGLPKETLRIAGGDLFVDRRRVVKEPDAFPEMWLPVHDTAYDVKPIGANKSRGWLPETETALWRQTGTAWTTSERGGVKNALMLLNPIVDDLAYNLGGPDNRPPALPMGDVRIACDLSGFTGEGPLRIEWSFDGFTARAEVSADGRATITGPGGETADRLALADAAESAAEIKQLVFAVRDGVATLAVNGSLVDKVEVLPMHQTDLPDPARELDEDDPPSARPPPAECHLRIVAQQCAVTLDRIVVERDVYFRDATEMDYNLGMNDQLQLAEDQFAVLGDNSARSNDSRFFGPVAGDSIKGVVKYVYFPPERWRSFDTGRGD
jgi:signal peptidase I